MEKMTELLFLKELRGIGPARINKFYFTELKNDINLDELSKLVEKNESRLSLDEIEEAVYKAKKKADQIANIKGISVVTVLDKEYPSKLMIMGNKRPTILFYKGDLSVVEEKNISIVGTREPSEWTDKIAKRLTNKIIEISERVIVSGLALGCDTIAHKTSIEAGGKTIAVLPCGINNIFPLENKELAEEIVKDGGLLISEYFPDISATQYTFVERDTLIAALADATFVVECGIKSGTMHTADAAEKLGRRMAAYYTDIAGKGNYEGNKHIIETKGASKVDDVNALRNFLNLIHEEDSKDRLVQLSIFDLLK